MQNYKLAALLGMLAIIAGCARNDLSKQKRNVDPIAVKLGAVALSAPMSATANLDTCDQNAAVSILDRKIEPHATHSGEMWECCQSIYACSPTAQAFLKNAFQSDATIRIGYADLKKLKVAQLGDKVGGMYLPKTSNVFLDVNLKTPRQACALLFHEVVHLFDPVAHDGEESLRTEFRAYWYQTALTDELLKASGPLGDDTRAHAAAALPQGQQGGVPILPYQTRESLLKGISDLYGFPMNSLVMRNYPKLPREP